MTAEVTHNHPEGIKGAQATAAAIFLARTGHSKPEIRQYVEQTFGYDLSCTCDEIRPYYCHVETCQQTVPEAIIAFLESTGFEDALRNAVSLGGDSDTLACITGGIAEAFYGMPQELRAETLKRLRRICGQRTSCSGRTLSEGCDTVGAESRRTNHCAAAPFCAGAFLQGESVVY